jgi:hypothetical protein
VDAGHSSVVHRYRIAHARPDCCDLDHSPQTDPPQPGLGDVPPAPPAASFGITSPRCELALESLLRGLRERSAVGLPKIRQSPGCERTGGAVECGSVLGRAMRRSSVPRPPQWRWLVLLVLKTRDTGLRAVVFLAH